MNSRTPRSRVLVVEDDPKIARLLADYLGADGLQADVVADGQVAVDGIRHQPPALVLLDLMLPGLNGVAVCRSVRQFYAGPIIMLTARVEEVDRLLGLDSGADDYVCKPFSPREVMARVKAQLRRVQGRVTTEPDPWSIDEDRIRIAWLGHWLDLTVLEFRMFRLLLGKPGRVFSRAQLLNSLHSDERDVSDRAIDSHVKNLRKKIQAVDPRFDCIHSVYGVGYRFECPGPLEPGQALPSA
jgi:two-component system response regulator BaeR